MLMAAGHRRCPSTCSSHGFLLGADGRKMSKSLGNVLDPFEVMDQFGTDALRFYLMRDVAVRRRRRRRDGLGQARYEAELANEYGNLASRTIAMIAATATASSRRAAAIRRSRRSSRGCRPRSPR